MADNDDHPTSAAGRRRSAIVAQELVRSHEARRRWVNQQAGVKSGDQELLPFELHAAAINYYYALRAFRDEAAIRDIWYDTVLWWEQRSARRLQDVPDVVFPEDIDRGEADTEELEQYVQRDGDIIQYAYPVIGFDSLEKYVDSSVVRRRRSGGRHMPPKIVEEKLPERLPPKRAVGVITELDLVASKLGFKPETEPGPTHDDEPGLEDVAWLLAQRGQTEALEQLPGDYSHLIEEGAT